MKQGDFPAFATMWGQAWEQCGRSPTPGAIELAFEALRDQPLGAVKRALVMHMRDPKAGQYPPKVADVMRHITGGHRETQQAKAEHAWRRVMENLNTYDSAVFDDPAIHYAIAVAFGSWERLGQTTEDEMPFRRQDFVRAYMAFRPGMAYPARLVGRFEREAATGKVRFLTHRIGDPDRCKAVEAGGVEGGLARVAADGRVVPLEMARRALEAA
ncbi:MAG: DUF6475 domain-containing protein [Mariprofundaceae bacterium]